jgi:hypothetical protein
LAAKTSGKANDSTKSMNGERKRMGFSCMI